MNKYDNLAKALYDVGKYSFTALVIGQFISDKFNLKYLIGGIVFAIILFVGAFLVNQKHK